MLMVSSSAKGTGRLIRIEGKAKLNHVWWDSLANTSPHQWEHWGFNVAGSFSTMTMVPNTLPCQPMSGYVKHFRVLVWPSESLDLNPIENLWGVESLCCPATALKHHSDSEKICMEEWAKTAATVCVCHHAMRLNSQLKHTYDEHSRPLIL